MSERIIAIPKDKGMPRMAKTTRPTAGQPKKAEDLPLDQIISIMLRHSVKGGFLCTLPTAIYNETEIVVSNSYINKIKDSEFLQTKELAKSNCFEYWTAYTAVGSVPPMMWKHISKNVMDWVDNKTITIDAKIETTENPEDKQRHIDEMKMMVRELAK